METKTLKKAQKIMYEILKEVDRICKKYNLTYWLDSGTLLGAIRHKGFIPWDDDLDISMPLDDYEKFCKIAQQELPNGMFLQTYQTDKKFPYDFAKIRSNKGKIVEQHEKDKKVFYNQGIFIDIIPVIYIKKNKIYRVFQKIMFILIQLCSYQYLNLPKFRRKLIQLFDKLHNKSNPMIVRSAKFPTLYLYINKKEVFPLQKARFEKAFFTIPYNSHKYLSLLYGDNYKILPPKKQQKSHSYQIKIYENVYE